MLIAWQYGLLPPRDWGEDCEDEMRLQIELWNRLVALERQYRMQLAALLATHDPRIAPLQQGLVESVAAIEQCQADLRSRGLSDEERTALRQRLAEAVAERRAAWAELKPLLAAARETLRGEVAILADLRYRQITEARNAAGLWWGNYNAVCSAFDVALGRLEPGQQMREQEWRGAGRLTNQIMGGVPATVLLQHGHAQIRIADMPAGDPLLRCGAGRRGALRLLSATVYSRGRGTRRTAAWPMIMHRPFPAGAVIKSLAIHRRRIGAPLEQPPGCKGNRWDWRWTATFSCEVAAPVDASSIDRNAVCGIDIGWRKVEGGLRVAVIVGGDHQPLGVPAPNSLPMLARRLPDSDATEFVLPQAWLDRREELARVWGIAARLGGAAGSADDPSTRRNYARLRHGYAHGLDRLNLARREIYRLIAKAVAERYRVIAIDRTNTGRLSRRSVDPVENPEMPPMVRRMRTWASTPTLVAEIERAARGSGGAVLLADGKSTVRCHLCGHENHPPQTWRADRQWRCAGCLRLWDQDENAARNLLAAATTPSAVAAITLATRQNKGLRRARMTRKASARKPTANMAENRPSPDGL